MNDENGDFRIIAIAKVSFLYIFLFSYLKYSSLPGSHYTKRQGYLGGRLWLLVRLLFEPQPFLSVGMDR